MFIRFLFLSTLLLSMIYPHAIHGAWALDLDDPIDISNTSTASLSPSLTVDSGGGVHLIWAERVTDSQTEIYYSSISYNGKIWTAPVDVFQFNDTRTFLSPKLIADSRGYLNLIYSRNGNIYFSQVYATLAGSAWNWSTPLPILLEDDQIGSVDMAVDAQGGLHVLYDVPNGDHSGIYHLYSSDNGNSWAGPDPVYQNQDRTKQIDKVKMAITGDGTLHIVWSIYNYPATYPPIGIRYVTYQRNQTISHDPVSISDGPYDDPGIIALQDREIDIFYSGTQPDRFKFCITSTDGGLTWSNIWRNEELGGIQGPPALVVDGDNNLHWIQIGSLFNHQIEDFNADGILHQVRQGNSWTPGEILLRSDVVENNMLNISAVVAVGNELHIASQVPVKLTGGGYQYDIFYIHRHLYARGWDPKKLPLPTSTVTPPGDNATTAPTPRATITPLSAGTEIPSAPPQAAEGDALSIIGIAILPSFFLSIFVFLATRAKKHRP